MSEPSQRFLKAQKPIAAGLIRQSVGLGLAGGAFLIAQAWCLANIVNGAVFEEQGLSELTPWLASFVVLLLVRSLLAYFAEQSAFRAAIKIKSELREHLYSHLLKLGPVYLKDKKSGEIATVISEGIESLEAYYARYLPAMALAALLPFSILVFVLPMDWQSALVMIVTAPLIPLFMIFIGKGAERLNQQQWQKLQRMGGHFLDVVQGLSTLKLFNASRREADTIARISEDYRHATMKVLRVAFLSALALEFFATVSIALVAVIIGFRLLYGEMNFLSGFFILLLAPEFYLPLRSLGTQYHARMQAIGAVDGILDILDTPLAEGVHNGSHIISSNSIEIAFDKVDFAYNQQATVLSRLSLAIKAGEHVALVGPSGAGKSTIVNMLLGFVTPQSGSLKINNVDIQSLDLNDWRSRIAWVPQNARLFHGSITDNIALGNSTATNESIHRAAYQANALEFIQALPDGFDTVVGEGGRALSGGQIQRIVLARAFLRQADVIILDEATANLDQQTEQLIQQAIQRLSKGKTVLTVAHRLNTVRNANRIVVLAEGQIQQQGQHQDLAKQAGFYKDFIDSAGLVS